MIKLIDFENVAIYRGSVIKFFDDAQTDSLCLMVCEVVGQNYYQFMVINGYKAGLNYWHLPESALAHGNFGISTKWLIENYEKWKFLKFNIECVYILSSPEVNLFNY